MNMTDLLALWDTDCQIDELHLDKASLNTPQLHSKYLRLMTEVKLKLAKTKLDYNTLRQTKFRYYRGELPREELSELGWEQWQGVKPLKSELDEFLVGDTDLNNTNIKIEYLNTMIYTIESILTALRNRNWDIRNAIAYKQFQAGG
jgi:hypothetical protein